MNDVVIASSETDAAAAAAVEQHHAQMAGTLGHRVETLLDAAAHGDRDAARRAKNHLVDWCRAELVPHAVAEEEAMYPAARGRPEGRLLVEGMLAEHAVITGLVDEVAKEPDVVRAGAAARSLLVMFESHLAKENELVLPLLAGAPDVSLADLLGGLHELLGGETHHGETHHGETGHSHMGHGETAGTGCGGHGCACGEGDGPGYPELDARHIPHVIRHATIFGALDTVGSGGGLVLLAPHDPRPLLAQVEQRYAGAFAVEYLERGPEAWRLAFVRRTAS